ncbi:HYR domain-containing protein [Lewinella sp. LCG006]|uniref:HYR domain-containing protein n=1 Tax=Lewinella sp. LCG006 TaxID=3231911 RepID=UPI00345F80A2
MLRLHLFLLSFFIPLWMMAQVVVTNTNDSGPGSLRAAITAVNTNPATDNITFNINGGGPQTITPLTSLPAISDADIVIDGTSQPGYAGTPLITIDGINVTLDGVSVTSDNSIVQGLKVVNFGRSGIILFNCDGATIRNNVVVNNGAAQIESSGSINGRVENNIINIDENGIVGTQGIAGVWLQFVTTGYVIRENTIGSTNIPTAGLIVLLNASVSGNTIENNYIGTDANGADYGNPVNNGVFMQGSSNNSIVSNTIAFNKDGIRAFVPGTQQNLYSENHFRCNVSPINNLDGANAGIQPPTITIAATNEISGTASPNALVELYVQDNTACPGSAVCQGDYLQTTTANGTGDWVMPVSLPVGAIVTALQIDPATSNTSELAGCTTVQLVVTNTNDSGPGSLRAAITAVNANPAIDNITFNINGGGPQTITPLTGLPAISDAGIIIDGTSQPGYAGTPLITIDGTNVGFDGISVTSDNSIVQGLKVVNCVRNGIILFNCDGATIRNNVVVNNGAAQIESTGSINGRVENNIINIDENGIVGTQGTAGIWLQFVTTGYVIRENTIGSTNIPTAGLIVLLNASVSGNTIENNYIGTDANGADYGNPVNNGVFMQGSSNNSIVSNTIAFNKDGIRAFVPGTQQNLYSENHFRCNVSPINNLEGANAGIQPPIITSAVTNEISGTASPNALVELYVQDNTACPGSAVCQGDYLQTTTANGTGDWVIPVSLPAGAIVTALQIDPATSNTSELASCATVEPPDTEDPVAICPGNITIGNTAGRCDAIVTFNIDATDDRPGVSVSSDPLSGSLFPIGMTTVTVTATDAVGKTDVCTFNVTVNDTQAPVATCPGADITADNDSGACGAVVTFAFDVSDNCPGATVTSNPASGSFFEVGTTTVTVTATDAAGLTDECTFDVIVNDVEIPVFDLSCQVDAVFTTETVGTCPAAAMISLNEGDELTIADGWMVGGVDISSLEGCVSDNCTDDADLIIHVDDIAVVDESSCSRMITVTFIAEDESGNFSDPFIHNYTFLDDTAPVFDLACQIDATFFTEDGNVCPADATISLNEGDEIDVFTGWTVGGVDILPLQGCVGDNCTNEGDLTITVDDITVVDESSCSRTITITFLADDGCGNVSEPFVCNYTFIDDTAPVFDLACQIDAVFTTEDGNVCPADATISLNEGDEIDVFTGWTVGGVDILPLQGCVGDNCTAEGDLTITVDDITVVDDGTCSRVITITFIADDGCGNFSEPFVCNYTFIDNTGPEVSFNGIPDGGTYVVECDLPSTTWDPLIDISELTISDNCSAIDFAGITEVLTQLYDGPCVGNVLTRWQQVFTVQDICGNTTVYTLFTEIIDTTPPAFTSSPADVTIECDETAPVPQLEAFDSCSEVIYNFNEVRTDGDCPNNYTLTRTWLASDGCGNTSVETQIVTVEDTTPPVIEFTDEYIDQYQPGQDVFVECSEYGNISQIIANSALAFDNCSGQTEVSYSLEDMGNFDCQEYGYSGHFVSTWKTKDECGNESVATINWFLVDETAPVFQGLPEDACASLDNLPPVADVQAVDDCELAVLTFSQSDPIDCDGGQYIERTWTAEDACGNSASYTQRISLNGTSGPTITIDYPEIGDVMDGDLIQLPVDCDQDIAFSVEELEAAISVGSGCGSGSSSIELNLMDEGDCQENGYFARYRLNVTATDACGNTSNLSITIDFVDMTPPVVSSANELTLNCGDEIPMIEATDACGEIASMTFVDSAPIEVSCAANPVAYDRTWTVTDNCGNATTFVQSIIVLDNAGPVFSGVPADMCNNTGIDVVVTAVDGCTGQQAQVFFEEVMSSESGCGEVLTRTWTATDACGNTSVATQQVFFDDDVAPEIEFTSDLVFGLESGDELFLTVGDGLGDPNDPLFLTADDVTVTDNCASITAQVIVETTISDDCAADGYLARYDYKFIATDPCGNTSSAKLTVFYVDNNAPDFFNVPDDVDVFCTAVPEVANVIASDDYDEEVEVIFSETSTTTPEGLLITRTWKASDSCGNTNSVSQNILVVNNDINATFSFGGPVIECNSDNNRLGVTPTGGTPPYTYQWQLTFPLEDGYITTDPTLPGILFTMGYITQTFSVLITDANGCEYLASVTVVCDFSDDEGDFTGNGNDGAFSMNVYPNPVSDQLMVKAVNAAEEKVTVSIYSLLGQVVYQKTYADWPIEGGAIDTRLYPAGTYLLRLDTPGAEPMIEEVVILR